jgi:hypothetical protein
MCIGRDLVESIKDKLLRLNAEASEKATHLNMFPILHGQNIRLIHNHDFQAREKVRVLFFLDRHAQPQRRSKDDVALVKLGKALERLSGDFEANAERVVDVARKGRYMIRWVLCSCVGLRKLVSRAFGQAEL